MDQINIVYLVNESEKKTLFLKLSCEKIARQRQKRRIYCSVSSLALSSLGAVHRPDDFAQLAEPELLVLLVVVPPPPNQWLILLGPRYILIQSKLGYEITCWPTLHISPPLGTPLPSPIGHPPPTLLVLGIEPSQYTHRRKSEEGPSGSAS